MIARSLPLAAILAATLLSLPAAAQMKPEDLLKARQGLMRLQAMQFGPLAAVAKGEAQKGPAHVERAEALAFLATLPPQVFPKGSEMLPNSKAKDEIWDKPQEFEKLNNDLIAATRRLADAAKGDDATAFKTAFAATAKVCEDCHKQFREE